jgi:hypothetical protein
MKKPLTQKNIDMFLHWFMLVMFLVAVVFYAYLKNILFGLIACCFVPFIFHNSMRLFTKYPDSFFVE